MSISSLLIGPRHPQLILVHSFATIIIIIIIIIIVIIRLPIFSSIVSPRMKLHVTYRIYMAVIIENIIIDALGTGNFRHFSGQPETVKNEHQVGHAHHLLEGCVLGLCPGITLNDLLVLGLDCILFKYEG
ncbi:GL24285 [Drosophila persimilis]|uniref:GL24285 n=1 Tax=Drosophila persimilis TaxID=7234 RepID=B4G530_DROPE|nr:GL24285 [Drosophila persimilis]